MILVFDLSVSSIVLKTSPIFIDAHRGEGRGGGGRVSVNIWLKRLVNKMQKKNQNREPPWQFCPESLDPSGILAKIWATLPLYFPPLCIYGVGVNSSKFDCSTINWSTLLAGNQLLDTKFINCSNPVNPGLELDSSRWQKYCQLLKSSFKLLLTIFLINYFTETARIQSARHFLQLKLLNILNWSRFMIYTDPSETTWHFFARHDLKFLMSTGENSSSFCFCSYMYT
jgi:hypothetical protein